MNWLRLWRRRGEHVRAPRVPPPPVDHVAERAAAVDARKLSQHALDDAIRSRQEVRAVTEQLRKHRAENRFAERIAETFRE